MEARARATELDRLNQQRRTIEQEMKQQAQETLASVQLDSSAPPDAIVLFDEHFHQGVIGIVAGRLKDEYKRPTIVFAKQDDKTIKGSARSIAGVHIRDILEAVSTAQPGLIDKFGGHAAAAGLSIQTANLSAFTAAFTSHVKAALADIDDPNIILSDGELEPHILNLPTAQVLRQAGPFGQGFQPPLFDGTFKLIQQRIVGERHLKMVLAHPDSGEEFDAIAFNIDPDVWPDPNVKQVQLAYQLDVNYYRGRESLQLLVEALAPLA